MPATLPDPFYYLQNFRHVLGWVGTRHADLLDARERDLIARIEALPRAAQALLVRMVMRKGDLFRHGRLVYAEIGEIAPLAALLAEQALIEIDPPLPLEALFALLRKDELLSVFREALGRDMRQDEHAADSPGITGDSDSDSGSGNGGGSDGGGGVCGNVRAKSPLQATGSHPATGPADRGSAGRHPDGNTGPGGPDTAPAASTRTVRKALGHAARKEDLLACLTGRFTAPRRLAEWHAPWHEPVYRLLHADLYERLRLLFFGNLHQDWSEFVLTELGLLTYETVEIPASARAFQHRSDVDATLALYALRERLASGEAPQQVLAAVPATPFANPWLEERRGKLLFHIGQALERLKDWPAALAAYEASPWHEARLRRLRVLEQNGEPAAALAHATALLQADPREEERQQLARMLPRLRRKLGLEKGPTETLRTPERRDLVLPFADSVSVEWRVQAHLHAEEAPVFYVENALINSLFGLLCWPAIFAPVPGAFFHAFHYGPADLHHPAFAARRATEFAACWQMLDTGAYRDAILATWREKQGRQSPFVFWEALSEELLALALTCIPPAHLKALFARLLADLRHNRAGFPDLIQFWPDEQRYLMLEVKGPGDRLQDNQIRWLDYCLRHEIPVAVSHVRWEATA